MPCMGADATTRCIGVHCGRPYIAFSREAPSFRVALLSAIADVERAGVGIELVGVVMEDGEARAHGGPNP